LIPLCHVCGLNEDLPKMLYNGEKDIGEKLRITVLFVQYEPQAHKGGFVNFRKYFDALEYPVRYFIIDNKRSDNKYEKQNQNTIIIGGDNSNLDFSGWEKGVKWLENNNHDCDLLIFANDSYPLNLEEYQPYISANIFQFLYEHGVSAGVIYNTNYMDWRRIFMLHPDTFAIGEKAFNYWVRTNLFIIPFKNREIIKQVNRKTVTLIHAIYDEHQLFDRSISSNLQRHIIEYLCPAPDANPKYIWHSRFVLSTGTFERFRIKARTILCEKLIALEAANGGAQFIDIRTVSLLCWLQRWVPKYVTRYIHWIGKYPNAQIFVLYIYKRLIKYARKIAP
jgi:hypothetical protein